MGQCCFVDLQEDNFQNLLEINTDDSSDNYETLQLSYSIFEGDLQKVKQCIEQNKNLLNENLVCKPMGRTALHMASDLGHLHIVEWLISQKALVNAKDTLG